MNYVQCFDFDVLVTIDLFHCWTDIFVKVGQNIKQGSCKCPGSRKLIVIAKTFGISSGLKIDCMLSLCSKKSLPPVWLPFTLSLVTLDTNYFYVAIYSWFNKWYVLCQQRLSSIRLHKMSKDVRILGFNSALWKCKLEGFMMTLCKISTIWLKCEKTSSQEHEHVVKKNLLILKMYNKS